MLRLQSYASVFYSLPGSEKKIKVTTIQSHAKTRNLVIDF